MRPTTLLSMLLVLSVPATLSNNPTSAQSPPPIVREEIPDNDEGDGLELNSTKESKAIPIKLKDNRTIYGQTKVTKANCKLENFNLPGIDSVSFVSDGKRQKSTLWLNQSFLEAPYNKSTSQFVDDSQIHQEFFIILDVDAQNTSLQQMDQEFYANITRTNSNVVPIEPTIPNVTSNLTVANYYNATERTFTGISNFRDHPFGKSDYKQMNIIIQNPENKTLFHILVYMAETAHFDEQKIKYEISKTIHSFYINATTGKGAITHPPSNWQEDKKSFKKLFGEFSTTYFSPIEGAYHYFTQYGFKLLPKTVYVNPNSSQGYIEKIHWNNNYQVWHSSLNDMSSGRAQRNIYERNATEEFHKIGQNWVQIPLNLRDINFPEDYSAFFFMDIVFLKGTNYCSWGEITKAMSYPLPDLNITFDPERPSMGPPGDTIVEVKIQALTNVFSNVTLSIKNDQYSILNADFRYPDGTSENPITLAIRPNGWNTTQLVIHHPSWGDKSHPITLEIIAKITSSSRLKLTGTDTILLSNVEPSPVEKRSSLTLDVLTVGDSAIHSLSTLNSTGIFTLVTAAIGFLSGWFIERWKHGKEEKKDRSNKG